MYEKNCKKYLQKILRLLENYKVSLLNLNFYDLHNS